MRTRRRLAGLSVIVIAMLVSLALAVAQDPAGTALRAAGFYEQGATSVALADHAHRLEARMAQSSALPPQTALTRTLSSVTIDIFVLDRPRTLSAGEVFAQELVLGRLQDGRPLYRAAWDEAGLNRYFNTWIGDKLPPEALVRDPWIDLRPGGLVVYADVRGERLGAVFHLDESGVQLAFDGFDVGGRLFAKPPDGELSNVVARVEDRLNRELRGLAFVDPSGNLPLQRILISDDRLVIEAW